MFRVSVISFFLFVVLGQKSREHIPYIEWTVFCWRITFFIFWLGAMDLVAYSMNCEEDLGDRLGYIVTLILTFVAFSDTLFDLIPDVPYLTFLVCVNCTFLCQYFCFFSTNTYK